jgi:hypothetical protein
MISYPSFYAIVAVLRYLFVLAQILWLRAVNALNETRISHKFSASRKAGEGRGARARSEAQSRACLGTDRSLERPRDSVPIR